MQKIKNSKQADQFNLKFHTDSKNVNIEGLKTFVEMLPTNSSLRDVILLDTDEMSAESFLSKLPLWLRLSRINTRS